MDDASVPSASRTSAAADDQQQPPTHETTVQRATFYSAENRLFFLFLPCKILSKSRLIVRQSVRRADGGGGSNAY